MPAVDHPQGDGILVNGIHLTARTCSALLATNTFVEALRIIKKGAICTTKQAREVHGELSRLANE